MRRSHRFGMLGILLPGEKGVTLKTVARDCGSKRWARCEGRAKLEWQTAAARLDGIHVRSFGCFFLRWNSHKVELIIVYQVRDFLERNFTTKTLPMPLLMGCCYGTHIRFRPLRDRDYC